MMRSLLLLTGLAGVAAKDPNLLTDDNTNFGAASLDYDKHGTVAERRFAPQTRVVLIIFSFPL
jgi:hypothetical protein